MGIFKSRSNEKRDNYFWFGGNANAADIEMKRSDNNKASHTRGRTNPLEPIHEQQGTNSTDSETDPTTSTDSDTSHERRHRKNNRSSKRGRQTIDDTVDSSSSEPEPILKNHKPKNSSAHQSSNSRNTRSKRRSKRASNSFTSPFPSALAEMMPYGANHHHRMAFASQADPFMRPVVNPFANKGEIYLCHDMATVADAMKLDLNTQVMLAYYDAKSLEDFCLMAESDLQDLISTASAMRRAIPPLHEIRKIEVLREWVKEVSTPQDESRLPAWIRLSQSKKARKRASNKLIPEDWKDQFKRDLPKLKHSLRMKGNSLSAFAITKYIPSFQSISMCGLVE